MNRCVYLNVHLQVVILLSVWFFIRQRKANYLQLACWGVTLREWMKNDNNYPTSKIRIWIISSEVFGSQHVHCALWSRLQRNPHFSSFPDRKSGFLSTVKRDVNQRRVKDEFLWAKHVGKRCLDYFFNLGHVVFIHTCHRLSGCEAARKYAINRSVSGMK